MARPEFGQSFEHSFHLPNRHGAVKRNVNGTSGRVRMDARGILHHDYADFFQLNAQFATRRNLGAAIVRAEDARIGLEKYPMFAGLSQTDQGSDPYESNPLYVVQMGYLSNEQTLRSNAIVVYRPIKHNPSLEVWIKGLGIVRINQSNQRYYGQIIESGRPLQEGEFEEYDDNAVIKVVIEKDNARCLMNITSDEIETQENMRVVLDISLPLIGTSPYEIIQALQRAEQKDELGDARREFLALGFESIVRPASFEEKKAIDRLLNPFSSGLVEW